MPPFSFANVSFCQGNVSTIEGEEPIDFWILAVDEIKSFEDELTKDRSLFMRDDFYSYEDIKGEILMDSQLLPTGALQTLRKYRYLKKMCQETWPDKPEILYGEPFEFHETQGEPEIHDI